MQAKPEIHFSERERVRTAKKKIIKRTHFEYTHTAH